MVLSHNHVLILALSYIVALSWDALTKTVGKGKYYTDLINVFNQKALWLINLLCLSEPLIVPESIIAHVVPSSNDQNRKSSWTIKVVYDMQLIVKLLVE